MAENLTATLIPGVIALLAGLVFMFERRRFSRRLKDSLDQFNRRVGGAKGERGETGRFFITFMILFVGIVFILTGIALIYRSLI